MVFFTDDLASPRSDPTVKALLIEECGAQGVLEVPEGANEAEYAHCA